MKQLARLAAAFAVLSFPAVAQAEPTSQSDAPASQPPSPTTDALFPRAGSFSASGATGVPFLAIGELAYGFGDGFALGALAAATPNMGDVNGTMAFGLRPRGVLFSSGAWRSVVTFPVLYYPEVDGFGHREPWMLANPTVSLQRRLPGGAILSVGVGAIAAACMDSIETLGKEHDMMGGVWNTAAVGGALPISARTTLFFDGSLIMRGVVPANDWIGGAPLVGIAGVSTRL